MKLTYLWKLNACVQIIPENKFQYNNNNNRGLVKLQSTYHDKLKTLDYLRSASEIISSNSCDGVRCVSTLRISISSSLEDKCTHKTISNWLASSCKTWDVEGFAQTIICHFAFIWAWALSINTCPWPEASQYLSEYI